MHIYLFYRVSGSVEVLHPVPPLVYQHIKAGFFCYFTCTTAFGVDLVIVYLYLSKLLTSASVVLDIDTDEQREIQIPDHNNFVWGQGKPCEMTSKGAKLATL